MTLPDVCPKDGVSRCKKKECHLYVVDWRTGDEQCIIGYRSTHKELSRSVPLEDTYAESTRIRLENKADENRKPWPDPVPGSGKRKHLERPVSEDAEYETETIVAGPERKRDVSMSNEEVVLDDKDTTVFESKHSEEKKSREDKKRKSLDEMMDLDLPDNYEEEFWK